MTTHHSAQALMQNCQRGVPGKGQAIEAANNLLADCYGTLGALLAEVEKLTKENANLREDRDGLLEAGAHL